MEKLYTENDLSFSRGKRLGNQNSTGFVFSHLSRNLFFFKLPDTLKRILLKNNALRKNKRFERN